MNLSQLEVFVAIVNTGSLKSASEEIGLTHSAVSYSLSKLEAELGIKLLERNRQGITLTRIGTIVLDHARKILSEAEIIRQQANRERGLHVGKIRFACVPEIPTSMLTGIIREFQQQYPDIKVILFQGREPEVLAWLENHIVDVGTVVHPEGYPLAVQFLQDQVYVLLAADHPLAHEPKISFKHLQTYPLIGTSREIEATSELNPVSAFSQLSLQYQVTETQTIIAMVAERMGIAILPGFLVQEAINEQVIAKPLHPRVTMKAFLVANVDSPVTNTFLEIIRLWSKGRGYLPVDA